MSREPLAQEGLRRHARVWLDAARLPEQTDAAVLRHARDGHPFVMRRTTICEQASEYAAGIPLGLRLPSGAAARGLAFSAEPGAVAKVAPPLSLAEALTHEGLPHDWREPLARLERAAAGSDIVLRVYGSVAWQCMTGQAYLHAGSDIDLLLRPTSIAQARDGLELLQTFVNESALPLDGELELPDGRAAAWKELLGSTRYVLVKSDDGVGLTQREAIWDPQCWN